ncbi:MAG: efflux RND transporter periplasmic adaptor subunit [Thermodesulfobacteriota bacterium]
MKKFFLLMLACIILTACSQDQNAYQAPPPPKVTIDKPAIKEVTEYNYFTGTSSAFKTVDLKAQVSGYLKKINFTSGDMVKRGDLLFIIDPAPYQAKLDQARADLAIKKAELKLSQATLKRKRDAYKDRAVSEVEVIEAEAKEAEAKAAVQAAKARIEEARINLKYTHIHAPFEGRIGRNMVDVGNLITTATLLGTIVDDQPIYAYFNMSENALLKFMQEAKARNASTANPEKGYQVGLSLANEDDYPHKGHIDYADPSVDTSTGTIQLRAEFENKDHYIIPGLFIKVRVPVRKIKDAVLIPDKALGADQRGSYALTVDEKNVVQYNPVEPGPLINGRRVIHSGLKADSRVIVNGLQSARPGSKVDPVQASGNNSTEGSDS